MSKTDPLKHLATSQLGEQTGARAEARAGGPCWMLRLGQRWTEEMERASCLDLVNLPSFPSELVPPCSGTECNRGG